MGNTTEHTGIPQIRNVPPVGLALTADNESVCTIITYLYGYLFNWYAASNAKFAPSGWHVPTLAEFTTLVNEVGDTTDAGGILKETGTTYWTAPNTGASDTYGFAMFGAGFRRTAGFFDLKNASSFWTTDTSGSYGREAGQVAYNSAAFPLYMADAKYYGMSIRLIKDDDTDVDTMTGNDGKVYPCVKIGNQVWTAANSCETELNDGTPIPPITDQATWENYYSMARCSYDNDEENAYEIGDTEVTITLVIEGEPANEDILWYVNGVYYSTTTTPSLTLDILVDTTIYCKMLNLDGSWSYSNVVTITTNSGVIASVSIVADPEVITASPQDVDFTATPVNGGATPTYDWYINNILVVNDGDATQTLSVSDGDEVYCEMTSSLDCATPVPATSNLIVIDEEGNVTYGLLYNWYAANNVLLGISGWHVPTNAEWNALLKAIDPFNRNPVINGLSEKNLYVSPPIKTTGFLEDNTGLWAKWTTVEHCEGTNTSGFNVNPSGIVLSTGVSDLRDYYCNYWCSDAQSSTLGKYKNIGFNSFDIYRSLTHYDKHYGFCIRLVKDDVVGYPNIGDTGTVTDIDGNVYRTKRMPDGKVWIIDNFRCQNYIDSSPIPVDPADWSTRTGGAIHTYDSIDFDYDTIRQATMAQIFADVDLAEYDLIYQNGKYHFYYGASGTYHRQATSVAGLGSASDTQVLNNLYYPTVIYDNAVWHIYGKESGNLLHYVSNSYNSGFAFLRDIGVSGDDIHVRKNPNDGKYYAVYYDIGTVKLHIMRCTSLMDDDWVDLGEILTGKYATWCNTSQYDPSLAFIGNKVYVLFMGVSSEGVNGALYGGMVELNTTTYLADKHPMSIYPIGRQTGEPVAEIMGDPVYLANQIYVYNEYGLSYLTPQSAIVDGRTDADVVRMDMVNGKDIASNTNLTLHGSAAWSGGGLVCDTSEGGAYGWANRVELTDFTCTIKFIVNDFHADYGLIFGISTKDRNAQPYLRVNAYGNQLSVQMRGDTGAANNRFSAALTYDTEHTVVITKVGTTITTTLDTVAFGSGTLDDASLSGLEEFAMGNWKGFNQAALKQFDGTVVSVVFIDNS